MKSPNKKPGLGSGCESPASTIIASPSLTSTATKFSPLSALMKNKNASRSFRNLLAGQPAPTKKKSNFNSSARDTEEEVKAAIIPDNATKCSDFSTMAKEAGESTPATEDEKQTSKAPKAGGRLAHNPLVKACSPKSGAISPFDPESVRFVNENGEITGIEGDVLMLCDCGQPCERGRTQCPKCLSKADVKEFSGYLYEKSKTNPGEMIRYWFTLLGKLLYRIFFDND